LEGAEQEAADHRAELEITVRGAEPGLYLRFESVPGIPLKIESLENRRQGIEVVAVHTPAAEGEALGRAT
jgi:hypothetical protein